MPSKSSFADLWLFDADLDKTQTFITYRDYTSGTEDTSNFQIIDRLFKSQNDSINNITSHPVIYDVTAQPTSGSYLITGVPTTAPAIYSIRFVTPKEYAENETLTINGTVYVLQTTIGESLVDDAWANGVLLTLDIDANRHIGFIVESGSGESITVNSIAPVDGNITLNSTNIPHGSTNVGSQLDSIESDVDDLKTDFGNAVLVTNVNQNVAGVKNFQSLRTSEHAVLLGSGTNGATGSVALSSNASAIGNNSVAIGNSSTAGRIDATTATSGIAIGNNATASGNQAIAMGFGSTSTNTSGVAVGPSTSVSGQYSVAVGSGARSDSNNAVSVGYQASAALESISMGRTATTDGSYSVAIGSTAGADANSTNSVVIGQGAKANNSSYSVVLGSTAASNSSNGIAIGLATTNSTSGVSIGQSASAGASGTSALDCIAIGTQSSATIDRCIAIGRNAEATGNQAISIGYNTSVSAQQSVVIGSTSSATEQLGIALGYSSNVSGMRGMAIGPFTDSSGTRAIAMGNGAGSTSNESIAIGSSSRGNANYAVALGNIAMSNTDYSVAIGYNANVGTAESIGIIQLGSNSASFVSAIRGRVSMTIGSDERDKTDIQAITNGLEFIKKIEPIQFVSNARVDYLPDKEDRTDEQNDMLTKWGLANFYDKEAHAAGTKKGERKRVGVKAQQVQKALEEVYGTSDYANLVNDNLHDAKQNGSLPDGVENQLTVAYTEFVPFLIQAVQEISERLERLEG